MPNKSKPNILIINRVSVVKNKGPSRSLEERIIEPITRLHERGLIDLIIINESDWKGGCFSKHTHAIMNRPNSREACEILSECASMNVKTIIDLDDLPIFFPQGDTAYLPKERRENFYRCINLATCITASTRRISKWIENHFPQKETTIIHTGLDFQKIDHLTMWPTKFFKNSITFTNAGSLKLGAFEKPWLETIEEALKKNGWSLDVFADSIDYLPPSLPFNYLGQVNWLNHKIQLNHSYPLSVTPLASSEDPTHLAYSQYKTPIKYIIYAGLGIPGIYSQSPIYTDEVEHGITGVLTPNTRESWLGAMDSMINDTSLRGKIQKNGMIDVRTRFSLESCSNKWLRLINEL